MISLAQAPSPLTHMTRKLGPQLNHLCPKPRKEIDATIEGHDTSTITLDVETNVMNI